VKTAPEVVVVVVVVATAAAVGAAAVVAAAVVIAVTAAVAVVVAGANTAGNRFGCVQLNAPQQSAGFERIPRFWFCNR
jgi:hypothetical protein